MIPEKLRQHVMDIVHEGHQGMVKTKERRRTRVWWPEMGRDSEKHVTSCHECQLANHLQRSFIVRKKFPDGPWEDLAVDLLGPLPNIDSILGVVDYYSRYFETAFLKTTVTVHVVDALEDMFTTHGLLVTIT